MTHYILKFNIDAEALHLNLVQKKLFKEEDVAIQNWNNLSIKNANNSKLQNTTIAYLQNLTDQEKAIKTNEGYAIPHKTASAFPATIAQQIGLPAYAAQLNLSEEGSITTTLKIRTSFQEVNGASLRGTIQGCFIMRGNTAIAMLGSEFYSIHSICDQINNTNDQDEYCRLVAQLNEIIPENPDQIDRAEYLKNLKIYHASSFSLDVTINKDGIDFNPVLFHKDYIANSDIDDESEIDIKHQYKEVLPENYLKDFIQNGFIRRGAQKTYALASGVYVFCEPELKQSLEIVNEIKKKDNDTKREFLLNPQAIIKNTLEDQYSEETLENLFVEDFSGYSSRVTSIEKWSPPVLPWIKRAGTSWVPETDLFGLQIGDTRIELTPDEVPAITKEIEKAKSQNKPTINIKGTDLPVDSCETAINKITAILKPDGGDIIEDLGLGEGPDLDDKIIQEKYILDSLENFEENLFAEPSYTERSCPLLGISDNVKSIPKPYQRPGIEWLQTSYKSGVSGALLADDMGLGKTFQVLSFLAWIRSFKTDTPILIIAPTSLLKNWEEESETHLHPPYLGGGILRLYSAQGGHLRVLKTCKERDMQHGAPTLNITELRDADWIVSSYETMRDYHHSLAKIKFSCIVFDEMQKLKNPAALVTKAAKSLQADFMVGLTGTPVENRLADIFSIADILRPGFLGNLKDFSREYERDTTEDKLRELKSKIEEPNNNIPPFMLRRMKDTALKDGAIPEKIIKVYSSDMPSLQANAYQKVIKNYRNAEAKKGSMLEVLQQIRSISLHPYDPEQGYDNPTDYIEQSARLIETFRILDEIKSKQEKVIIFVDSLKLQALLKAIFREKYNLSVNIINGSTHAAQRQNLKNEFQNGPDGFDIIILSPKAAGVGLTITAANHVIHLTRWWNPAVEDQATDRAYRIGQKKDVYVHIPMARHPMIGDESFDIKLNDLITNKRELSRDLLMPVEDDNDTMNLYSGVMGLNLNDNDKKTIKFDDIKNMGPVEFENWVLKQFKDLGYKTGKTSITGDGGVDGIIEKDNIRYFIQCKHTSAPENSLQHLNIEDEYNLAKKSYTNMNNYLVISNAMQYPQSTHDYASANNIHLFTQQDLLSFKAISQTIYAKTITEAK